MAKTKVSPSLPASSRMQMPSTSVKSKSVNIKPDGGSATKKMHVAKKGKNMGGKNPYC
jgi:hypothetical protein